MRSGAGARGTIGASGAAAGGMDNGWRGGGLRGGAAPAEAVDLVSESDSEDSEGVSGSDQEDEPSWIQWFCSLRGNELFCEVDEDYIEDDFNLSGLSSQVPYYDYALDMILDNDPPHDVLLTDQQHELLESAAEMLYGLIHASHAQSMGTPAGRRWAFRYIVTARGLSAMLEKLKNAEFGRCPRCSCEDQPCLPVGSSDVPGQSTVKIFCPKCDDIFHPRSEYQSSIDGAYFGTTFPHLLLMTYPSYRPPKNSRQYVPRVFGFKLHPSAYGNRETHTAGGSGARPGAAQGTVEVDAAGIPVVGSGAAQEGVPAQ